MVYKFKSQARLNGLDAQQCGERIEQLELKHGVITPVIVLQDAKKKGSPLHGGFEWDDSEAAAKYRLDQARYILRQMVVITENQDEVTSIRAFVSVEVPGVDEEKESVYTTITHAMSDPELRQQVLLRAYRELQQWSDRYRNLSEFSVIRKVIESTTVLKELAVA